MPWCTTHYRLEWSKQKAKELRKSGKYEKVKLGYYMKDRDCEGNISTFVKIYVIKKKD